MLKEFCTWLCTVVAGLTKGGNLQIGFRALDAPIRCHTVLDSGGPADFDLPYKKDMMIQVATRADTFFTARDDAFAVYDAIHGTAGWVIGPEASGGTTYRIWSIGALAKPQYIGVGEKGGFEYSTNYLITASPI